MNDKKKVYQVLANALQARANCAMSLYHNPDVNKDNSEYWLNHWIDVIEDIAKNYLPSGSGINSGTSIQFGDGKKSDINPIVLDTAYHHMDEYGFYSQWTDYEVRIYPDFINGIRLSIDGRNTNNIKDYLYEVFYTALTEEI